MHQDKILARRTISQPKYNLDSLTKHISLPDGITKTIKQCTEQEFEGYLYDILRQVYLVPGGVLRAYSKYFAELDLNDMEDRVHALNELTALIEQRKIACCGKRKIEVSLFAKEAG